MSEVTEVAGFSNDGAVALAATSYRVRRHADNLPHVLIAADFGDLAAGSAAIESDGRRSRQTRLSNLGRCDDKSQNPHDNPNEPSHRLDRGTTSGCFAKGDSPGGQGERSRVEE